MRSFAFAVAYWTLSIFYTMAAVVGPGAGSRGHRLDHPPLCEAHGPGPCASWPASASSTGARTACRQGLHHRRQAPELGDGSSVYDRVENLAFVTGDHLEKFPLMATVLRKLGAIVVNNCGGRDARDALKHRAADAHREGRRILIYPEGNLAKVGEKFRYRSGVWHMYRDFDMPVVPASPPTWACSGRRRRSARPRRGDAGVPGSHCDRPCPRMEFLARLEAAVDGPHRGLIAEAAGQHVTPPSGCPRRTRSPRRRRRPLPRTPEPSRT